MKKLMKHYGLPGLIAPAILFAMPTHATAQTASQAQPASAAQPSVQPPPSVRPTPGQLELSKMIWSTVAAVDHANRSGNYSVLRDISSNGFQINNNPAQLAQVFSGIRDLEVDLGNALLVPPTYTVAPQLISENVFRVQGVFQMRPISIGFDLYYQWEQGRWKLFGINLQPLEMAVQQ